MILSKIQNKNYFQMLLHSPTKKLKQNYQNPIVQEK